MNWVKSFVYKLILFLIIILIVNSGYSKTQQNDKKIKQYKKRYEANKKINTQQNKKNYKNYIDKSIQQNNFKYKKNYQNKYYSKNKQYNKTINKLSSNNNKINNNIKQNKINKSINIQQKSIVVKQNNQKNKNITNHTKINNNIQQNKSIKNKQINIKQIKNNSYPQNKILEIQFKQKQQQPQLEIISVRYKEQPQSEIVKEREQSQSENVLEREREQSQSEFESEKFSDYSWQAESIRDDKEQLPNKCDEKAVYDYNLLVLTWVPNQCYADKDCEKDWLTAQELRSPTIHMFKPYGSSSYYYDCFEEKGDDHCRVNAYMADNNFDYDEALRDTQGLLYDMSQFWPAQKFTHDDEAFYAQQWLNHGTCYLMNMIQDNQKAYKMDKQTFNRTIMIQYFRTAILKYKKLKIDVQPGIEYQSKQQFASDIGFRNKQTHFMIYCNNKNQIIQITFCFNRSKLPGRQVTIPCTFYDHCDQDLPLKIKQPL